MLLLRLILCRIRIIVKAVAINIVRVDLINIDRIPIVEIPATSRSRVDQTGTPIVRQKVGVNELAINHKFYATTLKFSVLEGHHSIANQNAFEVDLLRFGLHVIEVDFIGQVWNVFACV
jgi:hypothetical protein